MRHCLANVDGQRGCQCRVVSWVVVEVRGEKCLCTRALGIAGGRPSQVLPTGTLQQIPRGLADRDGDGSGQRPILSSVHDNVRVQTLPHACAFGHRAVAAVPAERPTCSTTRNIKPGMRRAFLDGHSEWSRLPPHQSRRYPPRSWWVIAACQRSPPVERTGRSGCGFIRDKCSLEHAPHGGAVLGS